MHCACYKYLCLLNLFCASFALSKKILIRILFRILRHPRHHIMCCYRSVEFVPAISMINLAVPSQTTLRCVSF
ncbi:hypothetical protein BDY19DRAFT_932433 [Irpex rosettiformis]|uniref:Uncharacterized protein n=1 Tax=Irpex rosettiformis TaxID=378272 RepID=A0ACB8UAD8_9APHY|nr:hypothetical protein BDY19DRAFT_932433 [Irpex rosettiformis]